MLSRPSRFRQAQRAFRRGLATVLESGKAPQTYIEKIVQKYAVGLPPGKIVRAGDYVMIQPERMHFTAPAHILRQLSIVQARLHDAR